MSRPARCPAVRLALSRAMPQGEFPGRHGAGRSRRRGRAGADGPAATAHHTLPNNVLPDESKSSQAIPNRLAMPSSAFLR